jgi:hypothetical protein
MRHLLAALALDVDKKLMPFEALKPKPELREAAVEYRRQETNALRGTETLP